MVAEMFWRRGAFGFGGKLAFYPNQRKVLSYRYAPVIEEDVVIGAQTEKVVQSIGAIVRRAQRTDVGRFGVRSRQTFQARIAHLTTIGVDPLDAFGLAYLACQAHEGCFPAWRDAILRRRLDRKSVV